MVESRETNPEASHYTLANHDKGTHPAYSQVPLIMQSLLEEYPTIEGFVLGGSYASGRFNNSQVEDIDFDVLYAMRPDLTERLETEDIIEARFKEQGLTAEIRGTFAREDTDKNSKVPFYSRYTHYPYVLRNDEVRQVWGLYDQQ